MSPNDEPRAMEHIIATKADKGKDMVHPREHPEIALWKANGGQVKSDAMRTFQRMLTSENAPILAAVLAEVARQDVGGLMDDSPTETQWAAWHIREALRGGRT